MVPAINPKAAYDPVRQFAPIGGVCSLPLALVSSTSFRRQRAGADRRAEGEPGQYSYASPGVGTLQHLAFELFMRSAGVQAVHVPYKGATAMMPDLMSGQVPIGIVSALAGVSQAKSGKIRALAVTSAQRLPNAPEIPALSETIPGFEAAPNVFLVAPAGFASERLASAVRCVVTSPEVQDSFAKQGATPMPVEPREPLRASRPRCGAGPRWLRTRASRRSEPKAASHRVLRRGDGPRRPWPHRAPPRRFSPAPSARRPISRKSGSPWGHRARAIAGFVPRRSHPPSRRSGGLHQSAVPRPWRRAAGGDVAGGGRRRRLFPAVGHALWWASFALLLAFRAGCCAGSRAGSSSPR